MIKKIALLIVCITITLTVTGCTTRSELKESEDQAEISTDSLFDYSETAKIISDYARSHGLYEKNTLCYKSDNYYKLDTTRYKSDFEMQSAYEEAVRDIVANGNMVNASSIYFFVEPVLKDENGNFVVYIDYEYEKDK